MGAMRLLIVTQKVDENDAILGFFHRWIAEFAKHCESVIVICLEEGVHHLPENVKVLSLGKEKRHSRLQYFFRFYRYIWQERKNYDAVFVHMNPEYVIAGGLVWKYLGKKITLWYTHKSVDVKLKIAEKIVEKIFTASKESFRLESKKVSVVGHGIDEALFHSSPRQKEILHIVTVGRISKTKRIFEMLDALDVLHQRGVPFSFTIVGAPVTKEDGVYEQELRAHIKKKPFSGAIIFYGPTPYLSLPSILQDQGVFINLSDTGSIDKAVLDAMAAGVVPVSSNEAFRDVLDPKGLFVSVVTSPALADVILRAQSTDRDFFSVYVRENHSLSKLIKKITEKCSLLIEFDDMVWQAARHLEQSFQCGKHHVKHTGSLCYLLDFYDYLGEIGNGKKHIEWLLELIVESGGARVFYPGHINPMNMSQNVIDTGAATDAIARFAHRHRGVFTEEEHARILSTLQDVAESYLKIAGAEKPLTNQRLWGLTGLASFARYAGKEDRYRDIVEGSMKQAFVDVTPDGFFRYYPNAQKYGSFSGYDGISAFYQSRCTAFMRYALDAVSLSYERWEAQLRKSEEALLAMYTAEGVKDLRLECKRWYWLSSYEVAGSGFDSFALAHSKAPEARIVLHNVLYQVRRHFLNGYLYSHKGAAVNFQCPIFWTAHLAWLVRIDGIKEIFNGADSLQEFSYRFMGNEVHTETTPEKRILINTRWQMRNQTSGIYENGLPHQAYWSLRFPDLPPRFLFSLRETTNHAWYALRGGYVHEFALRIFIAVRELIVMFLPRYSTGYGRIESVHYQSFEQDSAIEIVVRPASKYGTVYQGKPVHVFIK